MAYELEHVRPVYPDGLTCYAHTPNPDGDWDLWHDHSRDVGDMAAEFARPFGGTEMARFLGYTHDAGKLMEPVQNAVRARAVDGGKKLGEHHKAEGAALGWLLFPRDPQAGTVVHLANYGHHSRIPACSDADKGTLTAMKLMRKEPDRLNDLIERMNGELGVDLRTLADSVTLPAFLDSGDPFATDVFIRMIHSCLVDADFLDTAEHFNGRTPHRSGVGMKVLRDCFMEQYAL